MYSARNEGKAHCFDLIAERFGKDCSYVAIGEPGSASVALVTWRGLALQPCVLSLESSSRSTSCLPATVAFVPSFGQMVLAGSPLRRVLHAAMQPLALQAALSQVHDLVADFAQTCICDKASLCWRPHLVAY